MTLEYCSDAIALYQGKIVLVERLSEPKGYALPGGRRDVVFGSLESIATCATREFKEETGLSLVIEGDIGTYDAMNRDPRGPKISDVVYGSAYGIMQNEAGKTKVFLADVDEIDKYKELFVFDHYEILNDWKNKIYRVE